MRRRGVSSERRRSSCSSLHFQTDKVSHLQITDNDQFGVYDIYVTRIHKNIVFDCGHFDILSCLFYKQYLEMPHVRWLIKVNT